MLKTLTLGSPFKPKVGKERIFPPLDAPYSRGPRISFLEDVEVEQDLGWSASVVDMLTAKPVCSLTPLLVLLGAHELGLRQGTDHEAKAKLKANSEPPKVLHEMDDPKGNVCITNIK